MAKFSNSIEKISAGETASIENTVSTVLSISLISDSGCNVEIELMPRQIIGFSAGSTNAGNSATPR